MQMKKRVNMATTKINKKRNFTEMEIEVLVGEVEARREILFGGQSSGVTNKQNPCEWEHGESAV